jgi:hypothetical protein
VTGSCENWNEISDSNVGEFIDQMSDYQLFNEIPAL